MMLAFEQGSTVVTCCGLMEGALALLFICVFYHATSCEAACIIPWGNAICEATLAGMMAIIAS